MTEIAHAWRKTSLSIVLLTLIGLLCACQVSPSGRGDLHYPQGRAAYGNDVEGDGRGNGDDGSDVGKFLLGAAVIFAISQALAQEGGPADTELAERLFKDGPELPSEFSMSDFTLRGFVKADWPMVIDYEVKQTGFVWLIIGAKDIDPYRYRINGARLGRQQAFITLPKRFGDQPLPASIAIRATEDIQGEKILPSFRIYTLGAGPKAIGSVAIDQIKFGPPSIDVVRGQQAQYSFRSLSDFSRIKSEFIKITYLPETGVRAEYVDSQDLHEITRGEILDPPRRWDGRDRSERISLGQHQLQVRAWSQIRSEGDWITAWSDDWVEVSE